MTSEPVPSSDPTEEPRYDREILFKVAALAQQLQERHQETLTAREIETIGQEIGLKPEFVRAALAQVVRSEQQPTAIRPPMTRGARIALSCAWWSAGWALPFVNLFLAERFLGGGGAVAGFFLGWAIYLGAGIWLSHSADGETTATHASPHHSVTDGAMGHLPSGAESGERRPAQ